MIFYIFFSFIKASTLMFFVSSGFHNTLEVWAVPFTKILFVTIKNPERLQKAGPVKFY